jgi:hypothetical protein
VWHSRHANAARNVLHRTNLRGLLVVVHQGDDVYVGYRPKRTQRVIGADAIAAVRRVRQAVGEKKNPGTSAPGVHVNSCIVTSDVASVAVPTQVS